MKGCNNVSLRNPKNEQDGQDVQDGQDKEKKVVIVNDDDGLRRETSGDDKNHSVRNAEDRKSKK